MMDRILNFIGIGRASLVDDSQDVQTVQLTEGAAGNGSAPRVTDGVQRVTEFGFTSVPPDGTEVIVIRRNGDRGNSIAIATSHRASRPRDLAKGDVAIYDSRGRIIKLTADGIEIHAAGSTVKVTDAAKVRCECDVETTGDIVSRADGQRVSLNALHDAYNLHDHPPIAGSTSWGTGPPDRKV
ncbi:phage baseplate assembly protein [Sphingomonas sp. CARO-RG-8B-R24-01]|uniref:phage baseplate assembly protein domain-containing protein n=1 Tax=Sphingomonas sp. CARO-RG-8B-R24-01 TaxID=2914831 RepID=UPI001F5A6DBB|nr:phage baseplate assembly protein [Sphingomonas sp. CARO-RG-8B-R24-01]